MNGSRSQTHQATTRWFRSISYMCIKEIWVWAQSTRHKIKRQKSIFCSWNCSGRPDFWRREEERVFSLEKFKLHLCFSTWKIRPPLIQLRGKFSKFKMTSVTHFHYELDTCPILGLWIWQVSYTCQNSPISFPLGGKFKFWISFLLSLQNPPIDPSGLSTFESRPILGIGPQTCLGPKILFVPI